MHNPPFANADSTKSFRDSANREWPRFRLTRTRIRQSRTVASLEGLVALSAGIAVISGVATRAFELHRTRIVNLTDAWAQHRRRMALSTRRRQQSRWLAPLIEILAQDAPKDAEGGTAPD